MQWRGKSGKCSWFIRELEEIRFIANILYNLCPVSALRLAPTRAPSCAPECVYIPEADARYGWPQKTHLKIHLKDEWACKLVMRDFSSGNLKGRKRVVLWVNTCDRDRQWMWSSCTSSAGHPAVTEVACFNSLPSAFSYRISHSLGNCLKCIWTSCNVDNLSHAPPVTFILHPQVRVVSFHLQHALLPSSLSLCPEWGAQTAPQIPSRPPSVNCF